MAKYSLGLKCPITVYTYNPTTGPLKIKFVHFGLNHTKLSDINYTSDSP